MSHRTYRLRTPGGAYVLLAAAFLLISGNASAASRKSVEPPTPAAAPTMSAKEAFEAAVQAYVVGHDLDQAEEAFLTAVKLDPTFASAWFNLAVISEAKKDWPLAQGRFQEYLRLRPVGGDAERARAQLELVRAYAAGKVTPGDATAAEYASEIQRSRAYLSVGGYREAIAEAARAQALDPSRWEAYAVVSLCMAKQHKIEAALMFEKTALEHAPSDKRTEIGAVLASKRAEWDQKPDPASK